MKNSNEELLIPSKAELIWLVSIIFTEEFLYRYNTIRPFMPSDILTDHNIFLGNVIEWVYKNDKALKLLQDARSVMIYEDGEIKPKNQDIEPINTLNFLRYVEKNGIEIPSKIIKAVEYLIKIEHWEQSAAEEKRRRFPEISNEEFELLRKEPLWMIYDAILYVNKVKSSEPLGKITMFIEQNKNLDKLSLYITQAHKTKKLDLVPNANLMFHSLHEIITKPDYNLLCNHSVQPEQFISFIKTLPLKFPIFDNELKNHKALATEKPLTITERKSLLKIIYGMAIGGYGWDPKSSKTNIVAEITRDVNENLNKPITDDTVRKWLKEAKQLANDLELED
jgi:hypothetical protein